jgi:hypothetical protein
VGAPDRRTGRAYGVLHGKSTEPMNNLLSFLTLTAAIFVAVTVLLILLSHLESNLYDTKVDASS